MATSANELRERLLRAGIAPRHVRRYLAELADHLANLRAEEERAGRSRADTESAALARLGNIDSLCRAMIERRQFRSWSARAPWAMLGFAPVLSLAVAYLIACCYLWVGWHVFLPGTDTPFGHGAGSMYGLENIYFQAGKFYYFAAPVLIGWGIGLMAARQRLRAFWPTLAVALVAWMGATAQIHASQTVVPGGLGHISMNFFTPDQAVSGSLLHALAIFTPTALPYLIWRLVQKTHSPFA